MRDKDGEEGWNAEIEKGGGRQENVSTYALVADFDDDDEGRMMHTYTRS